MKRHQATPVAHRTLTYVTYAVALSAVLLLGGCGLGGEANQERPPASAAKGPGERTIDYNGNVVNVTVTGTSASIIPAGYLAGVCGEDNIVRSVAYPPSAPEGTLVATVVCARQTSAASR